MLITIASWIFELYTPPDDNFIHNLDKLDCNMHISIT